MIAGALFASNGQLDIYWLLFLCWIARSWRQHGYAIGYKGGRPLVLRHGPRVGISTSTNTSALRRDSCDAAPREGAKSTTALAVGARNAIAVPAACLGISWLVADADAGAGGAAPGPAALVADGKPMLSP